VSYAVLLGIGVGLGVLGAVSGLAPRRRDLSLALRLAESDLSIGDRIEELSFVRRRPGEALRFYAKRRLGSRMLGLGAFRPELMNALLQDLANTGRSVDDLAGDCILASGAGALGPFLLWAFLSLWGLPTPLTVPAWFGIAGALCCAIIPILVLRRRGEKARRCSRKLVGCYLDLVVLALAGGLGIEGALHSAALICETQMSRRLVRVMEEARDAGMTPWIALANLGRELGVSELEELAAAVNLAGTEGARVRETLASKAASIRRHELAESEVEANTVSERLFIPGVFMLLGFLVFIGYPAITRLTAGV
jgi:tight adherence protein C